MGKSIEEVGVDLRVTRNTLSRELRAARAEAQAMARELRTLGGPATTSGISDLGGRVGGLTRQLDGLGGSIWRTSTALGGLVGGGLRAATYGIGALAGAVTVFGLKAASNFEQSRISFQTLLGSVEAGNRMFADLQEFNLHTPFQLPDLTAATQQLVAYGFAGQEALGLMKAATNVAATGGTDSAASLARISMALGQIRSKGIVQMEEVRQLQEARFPALELLQEVSGKAGPELAAAMQQGLDPAVTQKFFAAIESGQSAALQKFKGGAAAQAGTLAGVYSNVHDNLISRLAVADKPLADALKANAEPLQNAIGGLLDTVMPPLTHLFTNVLQQAPGIIERLGPPLGEVIGELDRMVSHGGGEQFGDLLIGMVEMLPGIVHVGAQLVPVLGDLVGLLEDVTQLPGGAGVLVALFAANKLSPAIGLVGGLARAVGGLAKELRGLTAAQEAAAAADAVTGGSSVLGKLVKSLPALSRVAGPVAVLGGLAYEGVQGTRAANSAEGRSQRQIIEDQQRARGEQGPLSGVNSWLKVAFSNGLGEVPWIGEPIRHALGADDDGKFGPVVASMPRAVAPAQFNRNVTIAPGAVVLHNPSSDVDVTRALLAALDEQERKDARTD